VRATRELLGEPSRRRLALPGVEGGLLREPQLRGARCVVAVLDPVLASQLLVPLLDFGAAAGEAFDQRHRKPGHLAHGPGVPTYGVGAFDELHTERTAQVVLEPGVVALGCCDRCRVQGSRVEGQPTR